MSEAKVGEAFITHEFDEAIAIQQAIVDQKPHQLGDGDRWMGVVELRREHVRQTFDRLALQV